MKHPTLIDLALDLDDARRELARAQKRVDGAVEDERRRREKESDGATLPVPRDSGAEREQG